MAENTDDDGRVRVKKKGAEDPGSSKISRNCKRFTRLFHASFDESDESSMNSTSSFKSFHDPGTRPNLDLKPSRVKDLVKQEILVQGREGDEEYAADDDNLVLKRDPESSLELDMDRVKRETESPVLSLSSPDMDEDIDEDDEEVEAKKPRIKSVGSTKKSRIGKRKSSRLPPKSTFCNKTHEAQIMKQLTGILKKEPMEVSAEDQQLLESFPSLVRVVKKRSESRLLASERLKEFEDPPELLEYKCGQLTEVIKRARYLVVYSGAGISTSAQIPDYRGPNGIWTLLRNGQGLESQNPVVLTTADPTLTHMSLKELYSRGTVKHVLSQNIDGLHLRSGIPKNALSEVHGNMYVEVCLKCGREYVRLFDVTENTRRYEHQTGRRCYHCGSPLRDTVVHFGERGSLRWPLNWAGAEYNTNKADVILCIGSSLKVLRRYPWLWCMDQPANKRPKLIIVNLQWTPKDQFAALKINGRCDDVMERVMEKLGIPIPRYSRERDPIFGLATPLHPSELLSKSSRELCFPDNVPFPSRLLDMNNYIQFEPKFELEVCSLVGSNGGVEDVEGRTRSTAGSTGKPKRKGVKADGRSKNGPVLLRKGNGNGWLGNAWGAKPKTKLRKLK